MSKLLIVMEFYPEMSYNNQSSLKETETLDRYCNIRWHLIF